MAQIWPLKAVGGIDIRGGDYPAEVYYYYPNLYIKYRCGHWDAEASETDPKWEIRYFVYDSANPGYVTKTRVLYGPCHSEAVINNMPWLI